MGKLKNLGLASKKGALSRLGKRLSWRGKLRLRCRERDRLGWDWKVLESIGDVCTL